MSASGAGFGSFRRQILSFDRRVGLNLGFTALREFSLGSLFGLHLALFLALHFFLPLLETGSAHRNSPWNLG
jgi:hypothetical protein